jgi:glycogen operon protein
MLLTGDEVGRIQGGNNNAYRRDGEGSWLDWDLLRANAELFDFFRHCVAFRRAHCVLRDPSSVRPVGGEPPITWGGVRARHADWSSHCRTLSFTLAGGPYRDGTGTAPFIYVAMNMHWEGHRFELPGLPAGLRWHLFAETAADPPGDVRAPGSEPVVADQGHLLVGERSVSILVGR